MAFACRSLSSVRCKKTGEHFPVLFEMLPYRKDDSFYIGDYPIYSYFARAGFIMAKVDVRGTGSSEGAVPCREYSDDEIEDAIEVIDQLAGRDDANGMVGMWGISWGGFNAIQVAMRRPDHLHAVAAFHASDDLFHDDVRFIDGAFHINHYALEIDHELGLPATPEYIIDARYLKERFCARHVRDRLSNTVSVTSAKCERFVIAKRRYKLTQRLCYRGNDNHPARAEFDGEMVTAVKDSTMSLTLSTTIRVTADENFFHATVTRKLEKDGKHVAKRVWKEKIPRRFN